jgi:flagellar biosynthesis protein FlhA
MPGHVLVIRCDDSELSLPGVDVAEPVYGASARWVPDSVEDEARILDLPVATPNEVVATHLMETIKTHMRELVNRQALQRLLDEFVNVSNPSKAEGNRRLLNEMVPDPVPRDLLQAVIRMLLEEQISVRNLPLILEAIAEVRHANAPPEAVVEHVRHRLGFQLVAELRREDGTIPLIQLAPEWEQTFAQYEIDGDRGQADVALPPEDFNRLARAVAEKLSRAGEMGANPAVVTSTRRRRFLRTVLKAKGIPAPVLSFEEIGLEARPALVGLVPA